LAAAVRRRVPWACGLIAAFLLMPFLLGAAERRPNVLLLITDQ
jgi:hypothetical protein